MASAKRIVARCGLVCSECPAYVATMADSDALRKQTAQEWSSTYGAEVDWESVNCRGCQQDETLFGHCLVCGIRGCAVGKGLSTCAECADFGCEKVGEVWKHMPDARRNLEGLRG